MRDFDDVFEDLTDAKIMKKEVSCCKQRINGKTKWIIEIDDPQTESFLENKLKQFFQIKNPNIDVVSDV